jgi:hypothetical protein
MFVLDPLDIFRESRYHIGGFTVMIMDSWCPLENDPGEPVRKKPVPEWHRFKKDWKAGGLHGRWGR